MAGLEVIHMPANGWMLTVYHFVCHTWILWIQLKVIVEQCLGQLAIKGMAETSIPYMACVMCTYSTFWLPPVTV